MEYGFLVVVGDMCILYDDMKLTQFSDYYGIEYIGLYLDLERIFEEVRVDVVYIVFLNVLYCFFMECCACVGVHVLCEKPMVSSVEDCEVMMCVCGDKYVKFMIVYWLHFELVNLCAIEMVRLGVFGEFRFFSLSFGQ